MTWWGWLLIALVAFALLALAAVMVALAFVAWWWIWRSPRKEALQTGEAKTALPAVRQDSVPTNEVGESSPDDLKAIEGIGPKISGVLQESGITTFALLAESGVSQLERIVRQAGIRIAYPGTWPGQARLAAAGEWEALRALQGRAQGWPESVRLPLSRVNDHLVAVGTAHHFDGLVNVG